MMTTFSVRPDATRDAVLATLGTLVEQISVALGEVMMVVSAAN